MKLITLTSTGSNPFFCIGRRAVTDSFPSVDLGRMDIRCPDCHALHWLAESTLSSRPQRPEFEACCAHGKITLPLLSVPPLPLYDLYVNDTNNAKEFRENITQYNAALAFTSLGVNIDHSLTGRGPPVF